jgi:hypothetical protein
MKYEEWRYYCLPGYIAVQSVEGQLTFWWNFSSPSSGHKIEPRKYQHESWVHVKLNMKAMYCSETSVDFQRTTQRYIPEDSSTLYNQGCEIFKFGRTPYSSELSICWFISRLGSVVVNALCYKPERHGFETRWGEWFFSGRTRPWGLFSLYQKWVPEAENNVSRD